MINTNAIKILLGMIADRTHTIADKESLSEGRRAGAVLLEAKLRRGVLKMLGDLGVELENEAEVHQWMKAQERGVNLVVQQALEKQLQKVAESLGITAEDFKAARNERRRAERAQRKANGECIGCPKGRVRQAAPGSTRCPQCEETHNAQARTYRERKKTREGKNTSSAVGEENASGGGNETAATTTTAHTDGGTTGRQSPRAESSVEAPGDAHQVGPQRSDTGARLPFLTRRKQ